ncbi:sensor histidine kinase [Streptomyces coffeae]|uniref:histidine kinase n=1 Tax=Streptomyces coffeae TaxID=621382 RepID=A0ABS1NEL1_9ACTN|nr:GAF domain-containing sensor histidine kinase [Streptomyces coffeae]MBL1098392.1 GAF domain-containing protein [Streptomyces coffeae]
MSGSLSHSLLPAAQGQRIGWAVPVAAVPEGLAVVDGDGLFVQLNAAAAALCGHDEADLIGKGAPFALPDGSESSSSLFDAASAEHVTTWEPGPGICREFAYRAQRLSTDQPLAVVAFRDVTDERHRGRRIAAIARSSVKLASEGSLSATLDALAHEVLQADALAGVQIFTADAPVRGLRIMGSAGFQRWPDFFERLMQCHERGASLRMLDAFETAQPVVVPHRWSAIQDDPAWQPLRPYLGELRWDWFVSVPLMVRGRVAGILNAFCAPGQVVGPTALEFLVAMADQAAVAVDYAALLQREREEARKRERQRLARDLHDSIVQQVFSIGMQAEVMRVLGERGSPVPAEVARRVAAEVGSLSQTVLADLRAMVHELRPLASLDLRLEDAVRALVKSTTNRTGLHFSLSMGRGLDQLAPDVVEDVYRIVAEAVHNVVKHAEATGVVIRLAVRRQRLTASVSDDGHGLDAAGDSQPREHHGYGLTTMKERAERWGGTLTMTSRPTVGTTVRVVVPLLNESGSTNAS